MFYLVFRTHHKIFPKVVFKLFWKCKLTLLRPIPPSNFLAKSGKLPMNLFLCSLIEIMEYFSMAYDAICTNRNSPKYRVMSP